MDRARVELYVRLPTLPRIFHKDPPKTLFSKTNLHKETIKPDRRLLISSIIPRKLKLQKPSTTINEIIKTASAKISVRRKVTMGELCMGIPRSL
jgi:hypothetical protein